MRIVTIIIAAMVALMCVQPASADSPGLITSKITKETCIKHANTEISPAMALDSHEFDGQTVVWAAQVVYLDDLGEGEASAIFLADGEVYFTGMLFGNIPTRMQEGSSVVVCGLIVGSLNNDYLSCPFLIIEHVDVPKVAPAPSEPAPGDSNF